MDSEPRSNLSIVSSVSAYPDVAETMGRALAREGALGLILIQGAPFARIERRYGVSAHRQAIEQLERIVRDACAKELGDGDFVTGSPSGLDELALVFARPRSEDRFYRERLPRLVERIADELEREGKKIVYPYDRANPQLAVGQATAFFNPGIGEVRQLLAVFERARQDACLSAAVAQRDQHRLFEDLVFAEDVAVLYEPIVNLTTREVLGHEALVRGPWKSDLHSPNRLFELAEETGLTYELDCLCRRIALRGARGLEPGRKLFLNCLPSAIHDPAFRDQALTATLADLNLRPEDLVFEISERESIENFALFREARDHYKELGIQIALDDTGVAYGSLEAVMELAPDFIKVDLSLIRGIDQDPPRQELLRALHAVAEKLGSQVIAEGIERAEEHAALQSLGVPFGQGYLFGRAAPLRRQR